MTTVSTIGVLSAAVGRTAAIDRYLIERVKRDRVNLCASAGGQWITTQTGIDRQTAERFGFNLDSPAVQAVFEGLT